MDKLIELRQQRAKLIDQMRGALERAKGRGLTDREEAWQEGKKAEVHELDRRIEVIEAQRLHERQEAELELYGEVKTRTGDEFDPRRALGGGSGPRGSGRDVVLAPEQRVADWVRARHGGGILAEEQRDEEISLGRMILARATGDSRNLTEPERRAMAEGTDAAGGILVPEILSSTIIDRARAQSVAFRAGAVTAPMESDTLVLARLATGNTAVWKAEGAATTPSDQEWERVELKAKTVVAGPQVMSVELREDLSEEGLRVIENELAAALALALDLAILEGSGTPPEPRGIANTTGVQVLSMGANGLKPTSFAHLVQAHFAVLKQNAPGSTAAIMHPRDAEVLALLADTTGQPLNRPPAIADLPFLTTTQIATDVTQGTNSDTSRAYLGDLSTVVVGVRPALQVRLVELKERYMDNLQIGLVAWLRADVALMHPEHVCKVVGLRIA